MAFATPSDMLQLQIRDQLLSQGYNVSPVLDRQYFHSIYFREPGGILFEVATMGPGFAIDEPVNHLGETLRLPSWEETNRSHIEKNLPDISINTDNFMD
jgi:glyoxalase family protein